MAKDFELPDALAIAHYRSRPICNPPFFASKPHQSLLSVAHRLAGQRHQVYRRFQARQIPLPIQLAFFSYKTVSGRHTVQWRGFHPVWLTCHIETGTLVARPRPLLDQKIRGTYKSARLNTASRAQIRRMRLVGRSYPAG